MSDDARSVDDRSSRPLVDPGGSPRRFDPIGRMTDELWEALAIEDLTEEEANLFWDAISG